MPKNLEDLVSAIIDGCTPETTDPVEAAFLASDFGSVVRLLAIQGELTHPEIYGFAKWMLGHRDVHNYLTIENAGNHLLPRTIAACAKAQTLRRWGGPTASTAELDQVRVVLREAAASEPLHPIAAAALTKSWFKAFGEHPPKEFLERALRAAPRSHMIVAALVAAKRTKDHLSAADCDLIASSLPTYDGRLLENAIEVAFAMKRLDLLAAALSSVDDDHAMRQALRYLFMNANPGSMTPEEALAVQERTEELARHEALQPEIRFALALGLAERLTTTDQKKAQLVVEGAWKILQDYGLSADIDHGFLVDPWLEIHINTAAGERAVVHLPAITVADVRRMAGSDKGNQTCRNLAAFMAVMADEPEDGDLERVRSLPVDEIPLLTLSAAMTAELGSDTPLVGRVAQLVVRAAELEGREGSTDSVLLSLLEAIHDHDVSEAGAVDMAIAIAGSKQKQDRIRREARRASGEDDTSAALAKASDLSLIEAAVLTGLFRSPVDHVTRTVGPIEKADTRFEPTPAPGKTMLRALFSVMEKNLISVDQTTPPSAISEKDGKPAYFLDKVVWRFRPEVLTLLNAIRDTKPENWPDHWKASFGPLIEELGATEVLEYLNLQLVELGMEPTDDHQVIEIIKTAFAGGKSIAHTYYLAAKTAKDALAYRQRYRPRADAVQTRIVNLLRQAVEKSIGEGWDNAYSRVKDLPESILFDVLHRTLGRRGEAAFEIPVR